MYAFASRPLEDGFDVSILKGTVQTTIGASGRLTVLVVAEARAADEEPDLAAEASRISRILIPFLPPASLLPSPETAADDEETEARNCTERCLAWGMGQIGRAKVWNARQRPRALMMGRSRGGCDVGR
jgi:hypothetical protein